MSVIFTAELPCALILFFHTSSTAACRARDQQAEGCHPFCWSLHPVPPQPELQDLVRYVEVAVVVVAAAAA